MPASLALIAAVLALAAVAPPRPAPPLNGGLSGGGLVSTLRPLGASPVLQGLPLVGDAAAQCRSQCAKARATCDGDPDDCAQGWRQCLATCR